MGIHFSGTFTKRAQARREPPSRPRLRRVVDEHDRERSAELVAHAALEAAQRVNSRATLVAAIEGFIRKWDDGATPFVWVKTADEILAKAVRKAKETSVTGH